MYCLKKIRNFRFLIVLDFPNQGILLGYIDNRLKYEASRLRKVRNVEEQPKVNRDINENSSECSDIAQLIDSMKTVLTTDPKNIDRLKNDLKITRETRVKLLLDGEVDLLETFPYFFVCPDLVI